MTDYKSINFMCGIEIHQQIEGKKLFCNCNSEIRKDKPDFEVIRKLRASAGETGSVDAAASHEERKSKYFIYQGYEDTTCLVELDEEPPREINQTALKTGLEVARLLNCKIIDEIQVMRKTVIDGSNTSGFQRTALIGVNGWVEVEGKKIGIPSVCLEEEACQVIQRTEKYDVYNLSRLGIPLIEIGTNPVISSPQEAEKVSAKLGMILRSTGKVKRGLGTIRQDVNLSIRGGNRIEIKGFQDLKSIPKVIEREIARQEAILKSGKKVVSEVRKAEPDFSTSFLRPMPGANRMYPETDITKIIPDLENLSEYKLLDEKETEWIKKYKIPSDLSKQLVKNGVDFDSIVCKYSKLEPTLIARTLTSTVIELRRKYGKDISSEDIKPIFEKANSNELSADAIAPVMNEFLTSGSYNFDKFKSLSNDDVKKVVKSVITKNKGAPVGALMGLAMKELRGKVEGKKVMQLIKELS